MFSRAPDPPATISLKAKHFFVGHWRGVVIVLIPVIFCFIVAGSNTPGYCWCGYTLVIMGAFWMTECLPLAVTALTPMLIFPMSGVMPTNATCSCYVNDTIVMFIGSLMLAYSVELSCLHKRLAYNTIRIIGCSHLKLLLAICIVTTFASMWITNTAATTMMVPIIFAALRVFDQQGLIKMYESMPDGTKYASSITSAYFCATTYSATIGGIGTLIGTGTNLVFKGLFESDNPTAPELLSFPKFSAFGVPYMIVLEIFLYMTMAIQHFGLFRPNSAAAKQAKISPAAVQIAEKTINDERVKLGPITFWEIMVILLFGTAIAMFFCRSPQIFPGWADRINTYFERKGPFIKDSALSSFILYFMFLLPSCLIFFKNCSAKHYEQLPKGPVMSILDWKTLNGMMPYAFMFLLGGGFAISTAAGATGLNQKIAEFMSFMKNLPKEAALLIITVIVILVTNFASNVAVANVFVPITMSIAEQMKMNPLWACVSAGFSASHCFLLPVGTPGNLIVQGAASINTLSMVKCGVVPTAQTIFLSWLFFSFFAPLIWPELKSERPASWRAKAT